jgi:hypothetical protein
MSASGRKLPFKSIGFDEIERPLLVKADTLPETPEISTFKRPLYALKRKLDYYCSEGPLMTQSGRSQKNEKKNGSPTYDLGYCQHDAADSC